MCDGLCTPQRFARSFRIRGRDRTIMRSPLVRLAPGSRWMLRRAVLVRADQHLVALGAHTVRQRRPDAEEGVPALLLAGG